MLVPMSLEKIGARVCARRTALRIVKHSAEQGCAEGCAEQPFAKIKNI
jgi:hypothetical protein